MYFNLRKFVSGLLLIAMLFTLNGCGFHLKGFQKTRSESNKQLMQKLYIQYADIAIPYSFKRQLILDLKNNNMVVVDSIKTATAILKITGYQKTNQPINLIGSYSAGTYSAQLRVSYIVIDSSNNILQNTLQMKASKDYSYNAAQQLSSNQERENAFNTVTERISNNIVTQIQSIQPSPATIIPQESN